MPIPGSPPRRVMEPGTIPPPSTVFSSLIFVTILSEVSVLISLRFVISLRLSPVIRAVSFFLSVISSTKLFHSLHSGHFPSHLGDTWPQLWQTYSVRSLFFIFTKETNYWSPLLLLFSFLPGVLPNCF